MNEIIQILEEQKEIYTQELNRIIASIIDVRSVEIKDAITELNRRINNINTAINKLNK